MFISTCLLQNSGSVSALLNISRQLIDGHWVLSFASLQLGTVCSGYGGTAFCQVTHIVWRGLAAYVDVSSDRVAYIH